MVLQLKKYLINILVFEATQSREWFTIYVFSKSFLVSPQKHHETQIGHGVQHLVPDVLQSRVLDIQKGSDVRVAAQMTHFIIHNQSLLEGYT